MHTDEHIEGVEEGQDRMSLNFLWTVDCVTTSGMSVSSLFCVYRLTKQEVSHKIFP